MPDDRDLFVFGAHGHTVRMLLPHGGDHLQRLIRASKRFYEDEMLEAVGCALPEDALVVDVGANIGNHTLFLSRVLAARVVAVEPNPRAFAVLRRNVELNGLAGRVEIHAVALGAAPGRADVIDANPSNMGMATVAASDHGATPVRRLDEIVGDRFVHLVKVDVEGMEVDVLRGGLGTLRRCRPVLLLEAATPAHLAAVEAILRPEGYRKRRVFNATPTYEFVHDHDARAEGAVIERVPAHVRARLPATTSIVAGLATVAGNEVALRAVVASLLPQVDRLYVYLNRFSEVPAFLRGHPKIRTRVDADGRRYGDAGKFWGLEHASDAIYLTCDDDILYPPDYAERMVQELAQCDGPALVGVHGSLIFQPCRGYYADGSRAVIHFQHALMRRRRVHVLGSGTCAFHSRSVSLRLDDFKRANMADIWLAQFAQQVRLAAYAVPRPARWLTALQVRRPAIYEQSRGATGSAYDSARAQDEVLAAMYPVSVLDAGAGPGGLTVHLLDARLGSHGVADFVAAACASERDPVVMIVHEGADDACRSSAFGAGRAAEVHVVAPASAHAAACRSRLEREGVRLRAWRLGEDGSLQALAGRDALRCLEVEAGVGCTAA